MPPAARNVFVILFDLKANSRSSALHALSDVILYQQLSQSKDQYKLYIVNTAQSNNKLNYEGIVNIDAATNIANLAEELLALETGKSDWLEGLDLAVEELKVFFEESGIVTMQVLFITDLCSFERPNNGKLLDKIIRNITDMDIFLYVIGPPIDPPKTIFSQQDIKAWMASLEIDKNNSNLKIMKKVINKTPHSVMCSYNTGFHLFYSFKYYKGMQPWQVPLTFGTVLNMPASTMRLTKREPPFALKNMTTRKGDTKWAYEDQQNIVIDIRDTVSGLIKHGKFVKIVNDGRFKTEGPRSFQALQFTSSKNVPEYLLQSDASYLVLPDPKQPVEYLEFFDTLIEELAQSDLYILARRVYNKDSNPKFVVLIPREDLNIKGFVMCNSPYADDIAHVYKEQNILSAPKLKIDENISNFLDSINVASENCQIKVPLAPGMMVYSSALAIIDKVKEKLIQETYFEKKCTKASVDLPNFDTLKKEWPVREQETTKKEENPLDDFDDVDDFSFS